MNVFISWSGDKSGAVAGILRHYLPSLINAVKPFLSTQDIQAGSRWNQEIAANLETANVGIIVVTPDNINAPWLQFEAGAISKLTALGRAIVVRVGLSAVDIMPPLGQFQSVELGKEGLWSLLETIVSALDHKISQETVKVTFEALWPQIEKDVQTALASTPEEEKTKRTTEDMWREVVEAIRNLQNQVDDLTANIMVRQEALSSPPNDIWTNAIKQFLNGKGTLLTSNWDALEPYRASHAQATASVADPEEN